MGYTNYNYVSLANEADLTTPTSAQGQYRLGDVVVIDLSTPTSTGITRTTEVKKYMYVKSHAALTQYQPYVIVPSATAGAEWVTAAPVTLASEICLIGVPQVAFTSGYYGFVQIQGRATAKIAATTHTIGDSLKLPSAATAFTTDGTSGSAIFSANSAAFCTTVSTAAETKEVVLVGRFCDTPAT